jgi:hypothetical protein
MSLWPLSPQPQCDKALLPQTNPDDRREKGLILGGSDSCAVESSSSILRTRFMDGKLV